MIDKAFNSTDLYIDTDISILDDNDKLLREPVENKKVQLKRWFLTMNNPFWDSSVFEEVDINNTDLEIKRDYYNYDYVKGFGNIDLFEFHNIKVTAKIDEKQTETVLVKGEENNNLVEKQIQKIVKVEKSFVVERPFFKNYECLQLYFENLQTLDGLKYAIGQIEKGKDGETVHLQAGIIFKDGKRFQTMKKILPTAWLDKARGSNYDIKVYCTKELTRLEEPFEIGKFGEMRARNDYEEFKLAIKSGASNADLMEDYYQLVAQQGLKNIDMQRAVFKSAEYVNNGRNIIVTYIYGKSGAGKTKKVYKEFGFENVFSLLDYGQFAFDGYAGEPVVIFDEFAGQFNIQRMNWLLDPYPRKLNVKGGYAYACYTQVFICSNYSFDSLYKGVREKEKEIFETLARRIHNIIRVDENGVFHKEKESFFEELDPNEIELPGWTKRVCKVVKYDHLGLPTVVFDRHLKNIQTQMLDYKDLKPIEDKNVDILFGD